MGRTIIGIFLASMLLATDPLALEVAANEDQPDFTEIPSLSESQERFVLGNTLWTLVHEMAHALIYELDINVLGQEEDAADRIASIALLHGSLQHRHGADEANYLADAAEAWRLEWRLGELDQAPTAYWDSHPLDIQRYYNIVCLIHARNPELIKERPSLDLPGQRAISCDDYEYDQAAKSVRQIVTIYGKGPNDIGQPISIRYESPTSARHEPLARLVRESGIAEHVATQTEQMFALRDQVQIVFGSCLGDASAFWRSDINEIVICYDLMERFLTLHRIRDCVMEAGDPDTSSFAACVSAEM